MTACGLRISNWISYLCSSDLEDQHSERQIADWLNAKGIMSDLERLWSRGAVHQIIINEKYAGHNVCGRTSFKLKTRHVRNDQAEWIRFDKVFPAIVTRKSVVKGKSVSVRHDLGGSRIA